MRASLQSTPVQQSQLSPETLVRLRSLLLAEAEGLRTQCAEHEFLVTQLRGVLDVDSVLERELAEIGAARARETIADIDYALERLRTGEYGRCEACGLSMPVERLEAIPSARLCVACTGRGGRLPR